MSETSTPTKESQSGINADQVRSELLNLLERVGTAPPRPEKQPDPTTEAPLTARAAIPPVGKSGSPSSGVGTGPGVPSDDIPTDGPTPTCVQCGNLEPWGNASWCPRCGYFPAIGRAGEIASDEDASGLDNLSFRDLFPRWMILTITGIAIIVAGSALMERSLSGHLGFLTLCSLVQLSFGGVIAIVAHAQAVLSSMRDPRAPDLKAMLFNPLCVWVPVVKNLNDRSHLVVNMSWGLSACLCAALIYGPIHMDEMHKELAELQQKRKKQSVAAMMIGTLVKVTGGGDKNSGAVGGGSGQGDLEDAVGAFAGVATEQAGVDGKISSANQGPGGGGSLEGSIGEVAGRSGDPTLESAGGRAENIAAGDLQRLGPGGLNPEGTLAGDSSENRPADGSRATVRTIGDQSVPGLKPRTPGDRQRLEAVVFGYLASVDGEVRTLLLAAPGPNGRPAYSGKLTSESMSSEDWRTLVEKLPQMRSSRPLVSCPYRAHWVESRVIVSVEFDRYSISGLVDAQVTAVKYR